MNNYTNEQIARAAGIKPSAIEPCCPKCNGEDVVEHEGRWRCRDCRDDNGYSMEDAKLARVYYPDLTSSPGAVATWLLPVLEGRWTNVQFLRWKDCEISHLAKDVWACTNKELAGADECVWSDTWHGCVIEAVVASAGNGGFTGIYGDVA